MMNKEENLVNDTYYVLDVSDLYGFSDDNIYTKKCYVETKDEFSDRFVIIVKIENEYYLELKNKLVRVLPINSCEDNEYVIDEYEVRRNILRNKWYPSLLMDSDSLIEVNDEELEALREAFYFHNTEFKKISECELLTAFTRLSNRNLKSHIKKSKDAKKRILKLANKVVC